MDLKTFAVERKLAGQGDLLKYVAADKPIPVDVLSEDLKILLASRRDETAEAIVTDYPKFLRDNVKTEFTPLGENNFDVSGHIDDNVVASIEAVHKISRRDVVDGVITDAAHKFNPRSSVDIDTVQLLTDAEKLVQDSQANLENSSSSAQSQGDVNHSSQSANEHITKASVDNEQMPSEMGNMDFVNDKLPASQLDTKPIESGLSTPSFEEAGSQHETKESHNSKESKTESNPTAESKQTTDSQNEQPQVSQPQDFKRAYDFVIDKLKEKQLDKRLSGLHL